MTQLAALEPSAKRSEMWNAPGMVGLGFVNARVGAASLLLAALVPAGRAAAHGPPPTAHAVVAEDAEGPLLIKLGVGFALRQLGERFRFVCPATWGGELAAPAAALRDGTVVIGADDGLMLLGAQGAVTSHPDPMARGFSTELVAVEGRVFALRYSADRSEVLEVDAQHARVVWSDAHTWYSMAAVKDGLVLLRASATQVEQLRLSLGGTELGRQTATAARAVDYVFARSLGDEPLALLLYQTTPELVRMQDGAFVSVARGASSIAGPIAAEQGALLAVDGQLQRLGDAGLTPLSDATYVSCLERGEREAYACTRDGLAQVTDQGIGAPLFALTWLVPPDLTQLRDERARVRCDYQWQDLRFDLIALGMVPRFDAEPVPDAGVPPLDAGAPPEDAADVQDPEAGAEPTARGRGASRCALGVGGRQETEVGWSALLAGALVWRRRRRASR